MSSKNFRQALLDLPALCQGGVGHLREWLEQPTGARLAACAVAIGLGGAAYGFTLGLWRAPLMGGYVAFKLPFLIGLTLLTNGLINGMFAQVLGSGMSFRQTLMALLMSFATFALITGALSPIALGAVLNAPGPGEPGGATAYRTILLTHVVIIAFAGITAHQRFLPVLRAVSATPSSASLVFTAWLAGNLLVGAQLSWNLRPFFGQPGRPVQFLRADWNHRSFYESVWQNLSHLLTN
jgi:hypothetical protein